MLDGLSLVHFRDRLPSQKTTCKGRRYPSLHVVIKGDSTRPDVSNGHVFHVTTVYKDSGLPKEGW